MHFFELADETVWGATARILTGFLAHLIDGRYRGAGPPVPTSRGLTSSLSTAAESEGPVEVEIGIGKSGRRAYGFDDIAIVPSRRTRDPEDIDISWEIDAFQLRAAADGRGDGRRRLAGAPRSRSVTSAGSRA